MTIESGKHVTIDYTLKNDEGEVLDTTEGKTPLGFVQGMEMLLPGLEEALQGRSAGEKFSAVLPPEKAYGLYSEELVEEVPLSEMAGVDNLEVGMKLQAHTPHGVRVFTVQEIKDETVIVDGNHPLAGKTLHFDVHALEVREATDEELAPAMDSCGCGSGGGHDHSHGGGGCGGGGSCSC